MRCSGSPTTCIAADVERAAAHVFEALLFAEALKPLSKALGPFGEVALEVAAQRAFAPETLDARRR